MSPTGTALPRSIPKILAILGVFLLSLEVAAAVSNERHRSETPARPKGRFRRSLPLLLAIASWFSVYPIGSKYLVIGVPFMAGMFERLERGWRDHVLLFPIPIAIANACVAAMLPQLLTAVRRWLKSGRKPGEL